MGQVVRSDSEEEEDFTGEGLARHKNDISDLERERLVGSPMRLVLFSDLHKQTVYKRDITTKIMKEYATKRHLTNEIIEEAQKRFQLLFGFEWKELPKTVINKKVGIKKKSYDKNAKSGKFILINKLPDTDQLLDWGEEAPSMGLLMVVLAIIHLNEEAIDQEPLYQLLSTLGLSDHRDNLPDWKDTLEKKFTKQLYLEREKVTDRQNSNGGDVYVYRKGQRSREEIPQINIMRFVAEVFGEELTDID